MSGVTIQKMGTDAPVKPVAVVAGVKKRKALVKKPKFGILKGGKTARSKSRFEAVTDPAKSPPTRKSSKLRILTEKGVATRRAKIAEDSKRMPLAKIRQTLRAHGMPIRGNAPDKLVRKIYEDAQEAGMLSQG